MTRDQEYRLYRYKLAMDLLDGELENPNGFVEVSVEESPGIYTAEEVFKPEYRDARVRFAIDTLKDLGLTPRRARDIYGMQDARLLREIGGVDARIVAGSPRSGRRGRPHPGRPARSADQVAADMRALVEMDDPAPVARSTPSQSLRSLLEAVCSTPMAPSVPEVPEWGDTVLPATRRLLEGAPEPTYNPDGDIADDLPTMAVDRFGVEYEVPRKGKKSKDGKYSLTGKKKAPPPPKPQRRLVVKRNRPPVAPDD